MEKTIFKNRSIGQTGCEVFTLVDGDKVGDVVFEAGDYTLPDVVRIVNERSTGFSARERDGDIVLKRVIDRVLATKHLTTERPTGGNRHERRKAAALARRR